MSLRYSSYILASFIKTAYRFGSPKFHLYAGIFNDTARSTIASPPPNVDKAIFSHVLGDDFKRFLIELNGKSIYELFDNLLLSSIFREYYHRNYTDLLFKEIEFLKDYNGGQSQNQLSTGFQPSQCQSLDSRRYDHSQLIELDMRVKILESVVASLTNEQS